MTQIKDIYLAGGCFWGTEHYFKQIEGVVDTEVGFANGHTENPTYQEVYTDTTGFVETVHVQYNPEVVGLAFSHHSDNRIAFWIPTGVCQTWCFARVKECHNL